MRPPKPPLSDREALEVEAMRLMGRPWSEMARKVSKMRGADAKSISRAEATRRSVSREWIKRQVQARDALHKTPPAQNSKDSSEPPNLHETCTKFEPRRTEHQTGASP